MNLPLNADTTFKMRISSIVDWFLGTPAERSGLNSQASHHVAQAKESFADRGATEAWAEDQDAEAQYVDAGDLKKSLDKARQALRDKQ
jgi:hypothetical protein